MGDNFKAKVEAHFVKGAKEHAQDLNIMYAQAAKQKQEQEQARNMGLNIAVEEIVVDATEPVIDSVKKEEKEDFVL